jgi:hypothetical protein
MMGNAVRCDEEMEWCRGDEEGVRIEDVEGEGEVGDYQWVK